jgi:hypothetical protein
MSGAAKARRWSVGEMQQKTTTHAQARHPKVSALTVHAQMNQRTTRNSAGIDTTAGAAAPFAAASCAVATFFFAICTKLTLLSRKTHDTTHCGCKNDQSISNIRVVPLEHTQWHSHNSNTWLWWFTGYTRDSLLMGQEQKTINLNFT